MSSLPFPAPEQLFPPDAEEIKRLDFDHFYYVLPKNADRPFPISVFVANDMRRDSVDHWHDYMAEVILKCPAPAFYAIHDFRNPSIHSTPYSLAKGSDLRKLRPDLTGATA